MELCKKLNDSIVKCLQITLNLSDLVVKSIIKNFNWIKTNKLFIKFYCNKTKPIKNFKILQ